MVFQAENFGEQVASLACKIFVTFSFAKSVGLYIELLRNMAYSKIFVQLRGSELHLLTNGHFPVALLIVTIVMSIVPGSSAFPLTTSTTSSLSLVKRGANSTQSGNTGTTRSAEVQDQATPPQIFSEKLRSCIC